MNWSKIKLTSKLKYLQSINQTYKPLQTRVRSLVPPYCKHTNGSCLVKNPVIHFKLVHPKTSRLNKKINKLCIYIFSIFLHMIFARVINIPVISRSLP